MLVRQAIVSSPRSRALKNNELISSSDGIDDHVADTLCQRSPGRSGLGFGRKQSINFFQLENRVPKKVEHQLAKLVSLLLALVLMAVANRTKPGPDTGVEPGF